MLQIEDFLADETYTEKDQAEGYIIKVDELKRLIGDYQVANLEEMKRELDDHLENHLILFLDWINKVTQQQPMRLETDNEDIAKMYIHEKMED